jgi:prepilin peptidase CpaA
MFLLRGMGAGDVKLLGAVGAWLGVMGALWAAFYAVLAGGVLALGVAFQHRYLRQAFGNLRRMLVSWFLSGPKPLSGMTLEDAPGPRLPYAVAIAVGTAAAVWLK